MTEDYITRVIEAVIEEYMGETPAPGSRSVPVGVSNRHIHLTREHIDILFGEGYKLTPLRMLKQPDQFATKETLTLVAPSGKTLSPVRIIGPARSKTQVELLRSDCVRMEVDAPLRISGNITGSAGMTVAGPVGSVTIREGVIIAARHLHLSPEEVIEFGLKDGQTIQVRVPGPRGIVFGEVIVRSGPAHLMEFHIDVDEANACGVESDDRVEVIQG